MASFAYIRDLNPQIDNLAEIIRIVKRCEGDNDAIAEGIKALFDQTDRRHGYTIHSIKANIMTSLRAENLGVMTTEGKLTPFGRKLLTIADDEARFKESIAKHLILEKGGLFFCRGLTTFTRPTRQALADLRLEPLGLSAIYHTYHGAKV